MLGLCFVCAAPRISSLTMALGCQPGWLRTLKAVVTDYASLSWSVWTYSIGKYTLNRCVLRQNKPRRGPGQQPVMVCLKFYIYGCPPR
ncbi:hypothetical protein GGS20DRAFT_281531 [Poronia punctata]|nr:hypothetical protein GGS20DRAFT_281531 [Poronia punctata]